MLDYSLDKYGAKNFILHFEEDGENIKVYLASGDDYKVPNTKENKNKLLKTMEIQVKDVWMFRHKKEKEKKSIKNWLIFDIIFLATDIFLLFVAPTVWTGISAGFFSLATLTGTLQFLGCKKYLKDIEKNELFIRNKDMINEYLGRGNEIVEDKSINLVEEKKKEPILNINDVHDMECDVIYKILDDINRDRTLGIERPKVLALKYIDNKKKDSK